MSKRPILTQVDLEAGYNDERWLGWGYLGGREHLPEADRAHADAAVLAHANAHGWSAEQLFEWLNSRPGRFYSDDPTAVWAPACLTADLSR